MQLDDDLVPRPSPTKSGQSHTSIPSHTTRTSSANTNPPSQPVQRNDSSKHFHTPRSGSLTSLLFDLRMNRMVSVTTSEAGSSNPVQLLFRWTTAAAVGLVASPRRLSSPIPARSNTARGTQGHTSAADQAAMDEAVGRFAQDSALVCVLHPFTSVG